MPVQQDQLSANNTNVKFETINNDRIDRLFHDGTDIIKCRFQYPEIIESIRGFVTDVATTNPKNYSNANYLIDQSYSAPAVNAKTYFYRIKFSRPVTVNKIKLYSSLEIVSASLNAIALTTNAGSISITSRTSSFRSDLSPTQYEHILNFANTSIQEIRIYLATPVEAFNTISEIIVGEDFTKSNIVYYGTNGAQKSSYTAQYNQLIDMCYNPANSQYYAVRYRELTGEFFNPDDDFSTPSGSSSFDSIKWSEDFSSSLFFKSVSNNNLVFSTASGKGIMTSNAYFPGSAFQVDVDFTITTLTGNTSFFGLHIVDYDSYNLLYGVGVTTRGGDNYYKSAVKSYADSSGGNFALKNLNAVLEFVPASDETWTITYTGSDSGYKRFSVNGSVNGSQTSASGLDYVINYSNSYISFDLLASESVSIGNNISFIMSYEVAARAASSGTLNIQKSSSNFYTSTLSASFDETIGTNTARAQFYATTATGMTVEADDFEFSGGSYLYEGYPLLTVERVTNQAQLSSNTIEYIDVLSSKSITAYSQIPFGAVQIAVNGADDVFLKVYDRIYTFSGATNLSGVLTPPASGVTESSSGIIPSFGISSFHYSDESGGFLGYIEFDSFLGEIKLKTLNDTDPPTLLTRQVFFDMLDFNEVKTGDGVPYQFYLHADDPTTLFYLRKNGTGELNSTKTTGTTGSVTASNPNFTDTSKNFTTLLIKKGDLCIINETGSSNNGTYIIVNIPSTTTVQLAGPVASGGSVINTPLTTKTSWTTQSSLDYKIMSNAELLQFNLDPDVAAFDAVNVDNFSLQAGTGEIANITAEVINAWGDPLSGKDVNFQVIEGDGVVNPPSTTTNASGIATSQFTVGNVAGPIQVQVTVSD